MNTTHQTSSKALVFAGQRPPALLATLFFLSLLIAACRDSKVDAYRVPKEKDASLPFTVTTAGQPFDPANVPAVAPTVPGGGMPVAAATADSGLTWTAPASWQPKPLGTLRKGSYAIIGSAGVTADVSITAFPGAVGGEFANVNRWRGQLALPPIVESDLAVSVTHLSQNGLTFTFVDLVGTDTASPQHILGAMAPYEGAMWFLSSAAPTRLSRWPSRRSSTSLRR